MGITSTLFRAARRSADVRAVAKGRAPQRLANKAVGRQLWRIWR